MRTKVCSTAGTREGKAPTEVETV